MACSSLSKFEIMINRIIEKPFYFVRHGETDWNKNRIYQGRSDIPLNSTGIQQAGSIAALLKDEPIAHIVCSPLLRAKITAEIIGTHLNKPIVIIDELQELSLGEKEGQPIGDGDVFDKWLTGITPCGGESAADFDARVISGLLKGLSFPAPTLFVSHGAVFTAIRRLLKLPLDRIQNCQVIYHEPTKYEDIPWISTVIE